MGEPTQSPGSTSLERGRPKPSPRPMPMPIPTTSIADSMATDTAMDTLDMDMVDTTDMVDTHITADMATTDVRRGALNQQPSLRLTPKRKLIHGTTTADSMAMDTGTDMDTMAMDTDMDIVATMATTIPTTADIMDTMENKLWSKLDKNIT